MPALCNSSVFVEIHDLGWSASWCRKTYGINLIGGVRRDMLKHQREQCIKLIGEMREELKTLTDILLNTPNMEQRTVGVGVLGKRYRSWL